MSQGAHTSRPHDLARTARPTRARRGLPAPTFQEQTCYDLPCLFVTRLQRD